MKNNKTDREIIELLAYHEEALANYYEACYLKLAHKPIWNFLQKEEQKHAMWLRSTLDQVIQGSVIFKNEVFSIENISESIDRLVDEKLAVENDERTLSDAFEFSMNLENSIIEKNFLDFFSSKKEKIQIVLDNLKSDTEHHRELLGIEIHKFKKKQKELEEIIDIDYEKVSLLGHHSEYERLLGRLYVNLSKKFPYEDLWPFLAEEERKHETWIKQIIHKYSRGTISFEIKEDYSDSLKKCILDLRESIDEISEKEITLKEAFIICIDYENDILENSFFENFSSDAPAIENILKKLVEDTEKHRNAIEAKTDAYFPEVK